MSPIINKLKSVNPWHFLWVTVILSQIFTAALNAIQSYLRWGFVSSELLAIGALDALFVPAVVAPIIMIFVLRTSKLQEDIRLQQEFEKALRESEKKYKDLAELLPQLVFETDEKGNYIFANRHTFEISGYTEDDLKKGLNVLQMFVPEDRDRAHENFQRRLRGEDLGGIEYTAMRKDGSTFPVLIFADRIARENKIVGLRGIAIDITEGKRTERDLRQRLDELEGFMKETVKREFRIVELKDRIKVLEVQLREKTR